MIRKGDSIFDDRTYGTLKGISHVRDKEADDVFRLRANAWKLYKESGEEIFLPDSLKGLQEGESISLSYFYKEGKGRKPIRICAIRKSKEAQENGIRQIKKSNSKKMRGKVRPLQELFNCFVIVATSLSEEIETRKSMELYRMRWQIELVFKRFKSILHDDEIPSKNEKTAYAWFYGKLLIAGIRESLVNQGRKKKKEQLPQEASLRMEVRVIFELLAYLILFTYQFEKGLSRLGKLVEICSNSKRERLSAFYRFLLRYA